MLNMLQSPEGACRVVDPKLTVGDNLQVPVVAWGLVDDPLKRRCREIITKRGFPWKDLDPDIPQIDQVTCAQQIREGICPRFRRLSPQSLADDNLSR